MHGGRVEAASAGPGTGSEFRVVLPEFAAASDAPSAFLRVPPVAPATSRRILVVDDNEDSAASLATLLAPSGNATRVAPRRDRGGHRDRGVSPGRDSARH